MPRLLDLFCGAGGAAMGYHMAGWEVVGVDIAPQPNFPFEFHQADAMGFPFEGFDAVHASPPCQGYSRLRHRQDASAYPRLIAPMRDRLTNELSADVPWVIENVEDARLEMSPDSVQLCGSSFGLRVQRHRLFEANFDIERRSCVHTWQDKHKPYKIYVGPGRSGGKGYRHSGSVPVYGGNQFVGGNSLFYKSVAMGIDWMNQEEINESIPPAYTLHIGGTMKALIPQQWADYDNPLPCPGCNATPERTERAVSWAHDFDCSELPEEEG